MPEQVAPLVKPAAVRMNSRVVIAAGTGLWLLAFVVLAAAWSWVGAHHHRDWFWTCLAGWLLGLAGLALTGKHRREGRTD